MAHGDLWSTLVTAIDPVNVKAMPAVLQSTIDLLEAELATARAALKEIQPDSTTMLMIGEDVISSAMDAYRQNLIGRALSGKIQGLSANYSTPDDMMAAMLQSGNMLVEDLGPVKPAAPVTTDMEYPTSLFDILANSLVLDHLAPYLSISSLLSLASTSKTARSLVMDHPYVFRHLDLTRCRGAVVPSSSPIDRGGETWRSERMDESLTEDDFYSGPLRGIFGDLSRRSILQDVRTLMLDGLSVPADLVSDIVLSDRFNVSILSIRDCLHLNERKLMQTFTYAVRPSRAKGTPKLKGLYYFSKTNGSKSSSRPGSKVDDTEQAKNEWYRSSGKVLKKSYDGWGPVLQLCQGIIAFDAVLCRGPRHDAELYSSGNEGRLPPGPYLQPSIATHALGSKGCDTCHSSPEGAAIWGQSPEEQFPLLSPPPIHSSRIIAAKSPVSHLDERPALMVSCAECLADRCCQRCKKWWCSTCLPNPQRAANQRTRHQTAHLPVHENPKSLRPGVSRDCWECGSTCAECNSEWRQHSKYNKSSLLKNS
ncbi:hypothetical protein FQN54_002413 [Arachnomyces sp. PD_36]|nr:hypothetical protein FQN54_002413 [Arachnomyces sp. PD_36]